MNTILIHLIENTYDIYRNDAQKGPFLVPVPPSQRETPFRKEPLHHLKASRPQQLCIQGGPPLSVKYES